MFMVLIVQPCAIIIIFFIAKGEPVMELPCDDNEQPSNQINELKKEVESLSSKLDSLITMKEELSRNLSERAQQTQDQLRNLKQDVDSVCSKVDSLSSTALNLSANIQEVQNTVSSIACTNPNQIFQQIENTEMNLTQQLTAIDSKVCSLFDQRFTCGGTGGWRRVVYIDMNDPSTNCPSGWQLTGLSPRTCGRVTRQRLSCDTALFPVNGGEYTRVCGRIRGYQLGPTDGFEAFHTRVATSIDSAYLSGLSLTYGMPRNHIWSFAAGYSEDDPQRIDNCPCDTNVNINIPNFVGDSYFCESGVNAGQTPTFGVLFGGDPLWDGQNCVPSSTCCSFNNPPFFVKQLQSRTTESINARLCNFQAANEDVVIELVELYVQ